MCARFFYTIAAAALVMSLALPASLPKAVATENGRGDLAQSLALHVTADSLVVCKNDRLMRLYSDGTILKSYTIALGFNPFGPKRRQGDGRTPEGRYRIIGRNPYSIYHLSLRISYPDADDMMCARMVGVNPGGDIFIHGWPDSAARKHAEPPAGDWTRGCIAVTNDEIEELWRAVPIGTPVIIYP